MICAKILDDNNNSNNFCAGIGAGLLRNLFYKNIELNIVCADFVTNGSLAIAWHTFNEYGRSQFEPKIYHINRVSDPALLFGKYWLSVHSFFRSGIYLKYMHAVWYLKVARIQRTFPFSCNEPLDFISFASMWKRCWIFASGWLHYPI